jgi:uncharacterized protein (TIGR03000 family)
MFRRGLAALFVLALAATVTLLTPERSLAQRWSGGRGNWGRGNWGGASGYGQGYYGYGYSPYGYGYSPYGYGYSPRYGYGSSWYYPNYGYSSYYYEPDYYGTNQGFSNFQPMYNQNFNDYGAQGQGQFPQDANTAHIMVRVPANAEIWFEDHKTQQTGQVREFVSPPLSPNTDYSYHVRARWMENGREVTRDRNVPVRAGSMVNVDFQGQQGQMTGKEGTERQYGAPAPGQPGFEEREGTFERRQSGNVDERNLPDQGNRNSDQNRSKQSTDQGNRNTDQNRSKQSTDQGNRNIDQKKTTDQDKTDQGTAQPKPRKTTAPSNPDGQPNPPPDKPDNP